MTGKIISKVMKWSFYSQTWGIVKTGKQEWQ